MTNSDKFELFDSKENCKERLLAPASLVLALVIVAVAATSLRPPSDVAEAAFPGTNGKIVLVSGTNDIYSITPDGTGVTQLTFTAGNNEVEPVVSPNGQKIAFTSDVGAGGSNIWVMGIDGSNPTKLTTSGSDKNPTWSPDGTKIAFHTGSNGTT